MKKFNFVVNSLQFHDYKDRLQELFDTAMGKTMSIIIQPDNHVEGNSVPVYYRNDFVGYVTTGEERRIAYQAIKQSKRSALKGVITEVYPEDKIMNLCIETDEDIDIDIDDEVSKFHGWEYNGQVLPVNENVYRLRSMIEMLRQAVDRDEAWDEENEYNVQYIEENMWQDICKETQKKLGVLIQDMKIKESAEWKLAARRLSKANARLSKDWSTELRIKELHELAQSVDMNIILNYYGHDSKKQISEIPKWFEAKFDEDQYEALRELRYARLKEKQYQAMKTLLAMKVRLTKEAQPKDGYDDYVYGYFEKLQPYWNGKGTIKDFCKELVKCNFKISFRDKDVDLFDRDKSKEGRNRTTFIQLVGLMLKVGLLKGSISDIVNSIETDEKSKKACSHEIWKSDFSQPKFKKIGEKMRNFLESWIL